MIFSENRFPSPIKSGTGFFRIMRSRLLQFDQRSAEILRVQEHDRLAMRADFRLAVAEHARALALQRVARRQNIRHFVTEMMNAAVRIFFEKLGDRRRFAERLQTVSY